MSTNIALKSRTRCYSFDQYVRKCNDSLVLNMINKKCIIFPDIVVSTVLLLHPAHSNSKSRVYPLRCQDSGPPTRSYTAAAAGVTVRCCCCCGLGTRTHTRTVPMTSGWRVYIPRRGTNQQGAQQAGPDIYRLTVTYSYREHSPVIHMIRSMRTRAAALLLAVQPWQKNKNDQNPSRGVENETDGQPLRSYFLRDNHRALLA